MASRTIHASSLVIMASAFCAVGAGASCTSFRNSDISPGSQQDASNDSPTASGDSGRGDAHADGPTEGAGDGSRETSSADSSADSVSSADSPAEGGVCTSSTCAVTQVIGGLYGPAALEVDSNYVYWLEVGTMIPQAGGFGQLVRLANGTTCTDRSCVEIIDPTASSGTFEGQLIYDNELAVSANDLCYSQSFNAVAEHQISCFDLASLGRSLIDQDYGDCDSLWIGPGAILWSLASSSATSSDGSIRIRPIAMTDGGPAPVVASNRPAPTSVLADGTGTVWTEYGLGDAGGAVMVAEPDGGLQRLAVASGPVAVAEYGGYLYWLNGAGKTVSRIARAPGGVVEHIANTDDNPFTLKVDATGVYWAAAGLTSPAGSVAHAPLVPGGPTTVMMTGVVGILALAVDTTRVYVAGLGGTVNGGGSIVAMSKSR